MKHERIEIQRNRDVLKRMIDVILTFAKQGLALRVRDHRETVDFNDTGNDGDV